MTGDQFKDIRKGLGLTQVELAEIFGMHPVSISRFERDTNPEPIPLVVAWAMEGVKANPRKLAKKKKSK